MKSVEYRCKYRCEQKAHYLFFVIFLLIIVNSRNFELSFDTQVFRGAGGMGSDAVMGSSVAQVSDRSCSAWMTALAQETSPPVTSSSSPMTMMATSF